MYKVLLHKVEYIKIIDHYQINKNIDKKYLKI